MTALQDISRLPADAARVILCLEADDTAVALAAATAVRAMIRQAFPYKNNSFEQANVAFVLKSDVIALLVDFLRRHCKPLGFTPALLVVLSIFHTVLVERVASTPPGLYDRVMTALAPLVPELHAMCRSAAAGVVYYAAALIKVIMLAEPHACVLIQGTAGGRG